MDDADQIEELTASVDKLCRTLRGVADRLVTLNKRQIRLLDRYDRAEEIRRRRGGSEAESIKEDYWKAV